MNKQEVLKVAFDNGAFTARIQLPVILVMVEKGRIVDVRAESPEFLETVLTAQELDRLFANHADGDEDGEEFPRTFTF